MPNSVNNTINMGKVKEWYVNFSGKQKKCCSGNRAASESYGNAAQSLCGIALWEVCYRIFLRQAVLPQPLSKDGLQQ